MRETKGETQEVEECGGDERVREERSSRAAGKTVCVRPIFFFLLARARVWVTRAIEELKGARLKEEEEEERNDNERGS